MSMRPEDIDPSIDGDLPPTSEPALTAANVPVAATSAPAATTSVFARHSTFNGPSNLSNANGARPLRRQEGPRRLKNGIRFRRKDGLEILEWPAVSWNTLLFAGIDETVKNEGLEYARAGQTAHLQVTPSGVEASVQGRLPRPYTVRIEAETLMPLDWDRVVAIMAREAVYSAKLLAGEMPPLVEQPFTSIGRDLVPHNSATVKRTCTCESPMPCKHVACVAALLVERLAGDPLLAFTLRGLDGQRLLERLQEARAIATRGVARAHSTPPAAEAAPEPMPLDRCLDSFWRPGRQIDEMPSETEPFAPHALLRRLGQSPLQGKFPLVGLLASIYDSIAVEGRKLRDETIGDRNASDAVRADDDATRDVMDEVDADANIDASNDDAPQSRATVEDETAKRDALHHALDRELDPDDDDS